MPYEVLTKLVSDSRFGFDLRWKAVKILVQYAKITPVELALQLWDETPKTGSILEQEQYDVLAQIDVKQARAILIEELYQADQNLDRAIRAAIGLSRADVKGWRILEQLGADSAMNQTVRALTNAALLAQNHPSGQIDLVISFLRDSNIPERRRKDVLEVFRAAESMPSLSASIKVLEIIAQDKHVPTHIMQGASDEARLLERRYQLKAI